MTVARLGSFTSAAKALHISQPALTVQIQQLEEALNMRLFDRDTRSLQLTVLAREQMPAFERLLADYESISSTADNAARGTHGSLRIACLPSVSATILPVVVARFATRHPAVRIVIDDSVAERIVEKVQSGQVHFGIGTLESSVPGIDFEHLLTDRLRLVFHATHPLARSRTVSLKRLVQHDLVLTDHQSSIRRMIDRAFSAGGYLTKPAYEVTYISTALAFAAANLGVAILPASIVDENAMAGLLSRPLDEESMVRRIGIVSLQKRTLPPVAENFLHVLRARCGESVGVR